MQIEIDFEVFKALTALRKSETDSYNSVLRRLLELPAQNALAAVFGNSAPPRLESGATTSHRNALAEFVKGDQSPPAVPNALMGLLGGAWFNGVHFPEGTRFRATYKGATYVAAIRDGRWVGHDGAVRTSPSDAASAISGTNVNGWRFWYVARPGDADWVRMDSLRP